MEITSTNLTSSGEDIPEQNEMKECTCNCSCKQKLRLECLRLAALFTDPQGDGIYAVELADRYYKFITNQNN